jgi:ribose transport system permease protein
VLSLAMCAALSVLYRFTTLGRRMLAAGANPRAAEISGVRTGRIFISCHMLAGGLAALAGLMVTARTGAAVPSMAGHLGQDWLLPAFLAPVLGGTLLSGGRVAVFGTFLGAALVNIITSGLLLMRVGEFWIQAFLGLMLLGAVLADRARHVLLRRRGMI